MKYFNAVVIAAIAAGCLFMAGVLHGMKSIRKDAVIHDKAQWVSDTEGRVKFEWKK